MRLPSASWCVGASFVNMRRGRPVHSRRTLVLIVESFRDMLRMTCWISGSWKTRGKVGGDMENETIRCRMEIRSTI